MIKIAAPSTFFFSLVATVSLLSSCSATKKTTTSEVELSRYIELPELVIPSSQKEHQNLYHPSVERRWDLIHTKLDIAFNQKEESVYGTATLNLTPVFYDQDTLSLNAVSMKFSHIKVNGEKVLNYEYDQEVLKIPMKQSVSKGQNISVEIQYKAFPRSGRPNSSQAITNDKGFYFIDPRDSIPGLSFQVWTQGETSGNRKWFPTLDQPNEKHTQEISITLPDSLQTISNGILISTTHDSKGNRKDTWRLDIPHAVYLTMIAAGQWDRRSETWNGKPVDYYVPPGYGESAKAIFAHTTEMLDFFTNKFGYPFVWPKYTQVIVNEFVSGAMENTTAVTFGDFILFNDDDEIETGINDYIVAHELSHHWFGDLVTCESWANLTLNEGFANYSEYLWFEHKYGAEHAALARQGELEGYLDEAALQAHPLIYYHYQSENAMFDAHSYNKGGLVLHMLRNLVGDKAFFESLKEYLTAHAYQTTEVDDLRLIFEKVTGKDLTWFFDQWYFGVGHPELKIATGYNQTQQSVSLTVEQNQSALGFTALFKFPAEIAVINQDSSLTYHTVWVDSTHKEFVIPHSETPLAIIFDPNQILAARIDLTEQIRNPAIKLLKAPSIITRLGALTDLKGIPLNLVSRLLNDTSEIIQTALIGQLESVGDIQGLMKMVNTARSPKIQLELLRAMATIDAEKAMPLADKIIESKPKPAVLAPALLLKGQIDPNGIINYINTLPSPLPSSLFITRIQLLSSSNQITENQFHTDEAKNVSYNDLQTLIFEYTTYLSDRPEAEQNEGLKRIASNFYTAGHNPMLRRFSILYGLIQRYNEEPPSGFRKKLVSTMKAVYESEPDEGVRSSIRDGLDAIWNEDRT